MPSKTLYDLYETDPKLETQGIGLRFGDAVFFVKRAGGANTAYDTCYEERTRSLSNRLQLAAMTEEQGNKMLREVYAESVILGWEGVTDRAGVPMEYTKENFVNLMGELNTLWRAIRTEAMNHENFLKAQIKQEGQAVGNS